MLSVIVPAHNSANFLGACIAAIQATDLPRNEWELIVVDDASTDETPRIAASADKVERTGDNPRGPAFARNLGAGLAIGDVLVFIDGDVAIHRESLRQLRDRLRDDAGLVAVFGSYDDTPAAMTVVSRYRNLLHHYAHWQNAGEVPTFWAGCGAVRAAAFREAGGSTRPCTRGRRSRTSSSVIVSAGAAAFFSTRRSRLRTTRSGHCGR
jgi:Glycosyltransferases involved in cell wall biogenesis